MQKRLELSLSLTESEIDILLDLFPEGVCAFDLEMTGLSSIFDKIIEIAAVRLNPDKTIDTFHSLVNPLIPIPEHTIQYHKLTNDILRDEPTLKKPLIDFLEFYGNRPLIAHNAIFDISFLIRGIHEYNFSPSLSSVFDSCKYARTLYKKEKERRPENFKLSTLAQYFEFEFSHHEALDDAMASLKIFANCLAHHKSIAETIDQGQIREAAYLYKLNSFKKASDYILPKKLESIREKVQSSTPFEIQYKGGTVNKGDFRKVRPIAVIPMPTGLSLYAECLESGLNKYFKIKKIKAVKTQ